MHCWQADDVGGFEKPDSVLSGGGIQATGNYPGKARTIDQLRKDLEKAYSLIPGKHRFNLHALYGDFGGKLVDRDQIEPGILRAGQTGQSHRKLVLTLTVHCSPIPKLTPDLPFRPKIRAYEIFGLNM